MQGVNSKSSVYDMGTYTLNFSHPSANKKKTLWSFIWEHLESPLLLVCIGITSALLSYILSFASNFSEANKAVLTQSEGFVVWTLYSISNISLAMMSLYATFFLSPEAVGGGIADMKVILSGSIQPSKLSLRLLAAKFVGLSFALASGLSVGKEGPLVQMTSAVAEQLMLLPSFNIIHQNTSKRLEVLACACASGISSTFGAAYGGVLYSIEATCTTYMARNLPRAYLSSIVGMLVFLGLGATSHITLYTKDKSVGSVHHESSIDGKSLVNVNEMITMVGLGIVCGLFGVVFVKLIRVACILRNKFLDKRLASSILSQRRYMIVCVAAALVTPMIYLEQGFGSYNEHSRLIDVIFRVRPIELSPRTMLYFPVKFIMTIVCVTLPLPVGLFSPVFLLGGVLGRIIGHLLAAVPYLSAGIPPRDFALIGAAAFATGVTRAISTAVIVYELSGRPHLHLPLAVAILAAYFTANRFSKSVYDVLIECSGADYLHNLPKDSHSVTAEDVMIPIDAKLVMDLSCTYHDALTLVDDIDMSTDYSTVLNVALVQSRANMILIGTVNMEAMRGKIVEVNSRQRTLSAESSLDAQDIQTTHIRRFLNRMQSRSSFSSYGEMRESYYGHERIKFVMLKDKGIPLMAVTTEEPPGWKWEDLFSRAHGTQQDEAIASTGDEFHQNRSHVVGSKFLARSSTSSIATPTKFSTPVGNRYSSASHSRSHSTLPLAPASEGKATGGSNRSAPVIRVDPSPYQVDSTMRLNKIDSLMKMLKLNELYVTRSGRIVGIITRRSLANFIGDRERRPMDTCFELYDLMRESVCGINSAVLPSERSSWPFGQSRYAPIPTEVLEDDNEAL